MKILSAQKNSKNCIICGMENELGLKAPFYVLDDQSVASIFSFKSQHQSYPTRTHGGMISALLDELMGRALWIKEPDMYGVTTTMNITFRKPTPFNQQLKARAYITHDSKMFFSTKGEMYDMQGNLLAEGVARYLKLDAKKAFCGDIHADDEMIYEIPVNITEIDFPPQK